MAKYPPVKYPDRRPMVFLVTMDFFGRQSGLTSAGSRLQYHQSLVNTRHPTSFSLALPTTANLKINCAPSVDRRLSEIDCCKI